MFSKHVVRDLKYGSIAVIPTDTLYGIVGSALAPRVVEKIYSLRERNAEKPMIVLISKISDIKRFGVKISQDDVLLLQKIWPGKVSVIMSCHKKKYEYIHRKKYSIAFRVPDNKELRIFLEKTGPLVAPSANTEGAPPARTISEAKKYFNDSVKWYIDGGLLNADSSTIVEYKQKKLSIVREGADLEKVKMCMK